MCDEEGSVNENCDDKGRCTCKQHVTGDKCKKCAPGYDNFPKCDKCAIEYHGYPYCKSNNLHKLFI